MQNTKAALFDLDGVIVDTAKYHYLAWKRVAVSLGYELSPEENEQLKGVSRVESLKKILSWAQKEISAVAFDASLDQKNKDYLQFIENMSPQDTLPGILDALKFLKEQGVKIALGSASKNARPVLERLQLSSFFDAIIDGNGVQNTKPDPEVFTKGSAATGVAPEDCIVFEDAYAGIEAARAAGIKAIGIGSAERLSNADVCYESFAEITPVELKKLFQL